MRIYMSSITLITLALMIGLYAIVLIINLLPVSSIAQIISLLIMIQLTVGLLIYTTILKRKAYKLGFSVVPKGLYNPFANAIEIHMNNEAREQVDALIATGKYSKEALEDPRTIRKHYLNGICSKILLAFKAEQKVIIVAHNKYELELLRRIPGSTQVKANFFTALTHSIGVYSYKKSNQWPKAMIPFISMMCMFSLKYPVFWTEINPTDEAIDWIENKHDVSTILDL